MPVDSGSLQFKHEACSETFVVLYFWVSIASFHHFKQHHEFFIIVKGSFRPLSLRFGVHNDRFLCQIQLRKWQTADISMLGQTLSFFWIFSEWLNTWQALSLAVCRLAIVFTTTSLSPFCAQSDIFFCLKTNWRRVSIKRQKKISFCMENSAWWKTTLMLLVDVWQ